MVYGRAMYIHVPDWVVQVRRWEGEGGKDAALVCLL